jgi:hypothetical protein
MVHWRHVEHSREVPSYLAPSISRDLRLDPCLRTAGEIATFVAPEIISPIEFKDVSTVDVATPEESRP